MKSVMFVMAAVLVAGLSGCAADVTPASEEVRQGCGGIAGIACPDGFTCVDDPRDSCDPARGGADCSGVCRRTRCRYNDPSKTYVSRSASECALIRFVCAEGSEYFADDCGCGCQEPTSACAALALCVDGFEWDAERCACVRTRGEPCGPVTCNSDEVCCNASCGICTAPGGFCTQQLCGTGE